MNEHDATIERDAASRRAMGFATAIIVVFAMRLGIATVGGFPDLSVGFAMDSGWPELICLVWPILLGVLILRLKWPGLMVAAAITMLVLLLHRLIAAGLGIMAYLDVTSVNQPSWVRFARAFELDGDPIAVLAARIGGFLVDMILAGAAIRPALRSRRISAGPTRGHPSRDIGVRMAILGSLVFAFLSLGTLAWDAYIHVLASSPRFRQLVLRDDTGPRQVRNAPRGSVSLWKPGRLLQLIYGSLRHQQKGDLAAARTSATNALRQIQLATVRRNSEELRKDRALIAMSLNNLAWGFATGDAPEEEPQLAVDLARESVRLAPGEGTSWNTLGVALLRASADSEAEKAFRRSMELRQGGDSFDWLFLAILRQRAGRTDEAREFYIRSAQWDATHRPRDRELLRFEAEAARALGLPAPSRPGAGQSVEESSSSSSSPSTGRPLRKSASASGSM